MEWHRLFGLGKDLKNYLLGMYVHCTRDYRRQRIWI